MEYPQQSDSELFATLKENLYERPAVVGQRFLNYLIDLVFLYLVVIVIAAIYGVVAVSAAIDIENLSGPGVMLEYLLIYSSYVTIYTFFETITKGKTIGKMITKTRAVRTDGSPISFNDALKRSLIRIIPFESLSTFGGNPWHDRWSDTKVIRENN